jgi:hypothetical protein
VAPVAGRIRPHARPALADGALGITVLHYPPGRLRAEPRVVADEIGKALRMGRSRPPLAIRVGAER